MHIIWCERKGARIEEPKANTQHSLKPRACLGEVSHLPASPSPFLCFFLLLLFLLSSSSSFRHIIGCESYTCISINLWNPCFPVEVTIHIYYLLGDTPWWAPRVPFLRILTFSWWCWDRARRVPGSGLGWRGARAHGTCTWREVPVGLFLSLLFALCVPFLSEFILLCFFLLMGIL